MIKQRLLRNDQFRPPVYHQAAGSSKDDSNNQHDYIQLTPVKNLLGYEGNSFYLFGMLSQLKQGEWYLEDLDADVRLDLSEASMSPGIFTETCFVMVHGIYLEPNLFKVNEMVMPPPEHREDSM